MHLAKAALCCSRMRPPHPYGTPWQSRPGAPGSPETVPNARRDARAVMALVLGVLSMTCLGFLAGIPAIVVGAMSRKEIDRAQGALSGRGLAAGGIVTGLFGTGISLIVLMSLLSGVIQGENPGGAATPRIGAPFQVPIAAGTRSYGSLDVVDLDAKGLLKIQIAAIAKLASGKKRTVILQTYVRSSRECAEVAAALPDTRMQRALTNVTLIRVDIAAFQDELNAMRVETDSAPWFYKLDEHARPTDAISADEWDANIPENMAPVLGEFARGALGGRRSPSPVGTAL